MSHHLVQRTVWSLEIERHGTGHSSPYICMRASSVWSFSEKWESSCQPYSSTDASGMLPDDQELMTAEPSFSHSRGTWLMASIGLGRKGTLTLSIHKIIYWAHSLQTALSSPDDYLGHSEVHFAGSQYHPSNFTLLCLHLHSDVGHFTIVWCLIHLQHFSLSKCDHKPSP
jgi:hypothetical protein